MTILGCASRAMLHHWRTHLPAMGFVGLATAIVIGALAVQTSIRSHLYDALVVPLGSIDSALTTNGLFDAGLGGKEGASALALNSTASDEHGNVTVTATVWGIGPDAGVLWHGFKPPAAGSAQISAALATQLRAAVGSRVFLRITVPNGPPLSTIFGKKLAGDSTMEVAVSVAQILPDGGIGDLSLVPRVGAKSIAVVDRDWICSELKIPRKANVAFFVGPLKDWNPNPRLSLADHGLSIVTRKAMTAVRSDRILLTDGQTAAIRKAAARCGSTATAYSVAIAEEVKSGPNRTSYAMVGASLDALLAPGVQVNDWEAADLQADAGSKIELTLLVPDAGGSVGRKTFASTVSGVTPTDSTWRILVPDIAGMTDSVSLSDWKMPFPIDFARLTPRDEAYWKRYRATPKVFADRAMVRSAWQSPNPVTSIVVSGGDLGTFPTALGQELNPADSGIALVRVRENAIKASRGSSDLAGLLLGLSSFLILASLGLAGSLLHLNLKSRTREFEIMTTLGLPRWVIARCVLAEIGMVSFAGAIIGIPVGALIAELSLRMFAAWMPPEASLGHVNLVFTWPDAAAGVSLGIGCAVTAVALYIWRLPSAHRASRLRSPKPPKVPVTSGARFLLRSIATRPYRFLSVTLVVGAGTAVLGIAAGSFNSNVALDSSGFTLQAETSLPVAIDWSTAEGRRKIRFDPQDEAAFRDVKVVSMLHSSGDNVSCLNPAKPVVPRIAAVDRRWIESPPFAAAGIGGRNAWPLLEGSSGSAGSIPAVGDADTLDWILESGVGGKLHFTAATGSIRDLEFVGATHGTFLSGDLLVSKAGFQSLYPNIQAPTLFLVKTPPAKIAEVRAAILRNLADYGVSVRETKSILASVRGVVNAYVSIFLVFGLLGILLGVGGTSLAAVRNAMERRSEYALMLAVGLPTRAVRYWLIAETHLAVVLGALVGCLLCVIAGWAEHASPAWIAVGGATAAVVLASTGACSAVSAVFLRKGVLEALRSE